jgi:two-component system, LytTR family, response regulator AlgR
MMRVLVADDEAPARGKLQRWLSEQSDVQVIAESEDGLHAAEAIERLKPDVAFLDIQMPGLSGLEVAAQLEQETAPLIVFVTAFDEHAIKAFELNAIDYLLKPVRAARLAAALKKALAASPGREQLANAAREAREYLSVVERNRIVLLPVKDIVFLRAEQKYVTVRTAAREHLIEEPLVALEREFAGRLIRIHRSCLVARAAIRGFERNPGDEEAQWLVVLEGVPDKLPVSRRQWPAVRELVADK